MRILKSKIAICTLATVLLAQWGAGAFAQDATTTVVTGGPLTRSGNPIWTVVSFPLRVVTGVGGMLVGSVVQGGKNIVSTEQEFAQNTWGQAQSNPALYPVGAAGSVIAVPLGFVTGMPEGAATGGRYGYTVWDRL